MACRRSVEKKVTHIPVIKIEEEEVCIKQEETDVAIDAVKTEDEEEKPYSSLLHGIKLETEDNTEDSCETEDSEDDDWTETSGVTSRLLTVTKCIFWETDETVHEKLSFSECGQRIPQLDLPELAYHDSEKNMLGYRKIMVKNGSLMGHEKSHPGEAPLHCSVCGIQFPSETELRRHERRHERRYERRHSEEKTVGSTETGRLNKHERIRNTGEKVFDCSLCDRKFDSKTTLMRHERIHTGEKPFSCTVCGKFFATKGTLKAHERVHTGERPFSCSFCGKKYARNARLRDHEKVHTGENPYSCSYCGETFRLKGKLKQHEKIHTVS